MKYLKKLPLWKKSWHFGCDPPHSKVVFHDKSVSSSPQNISFYMSLYKKSAFHMPENQWMLTKRTS